MDVFQFFTYLKQFNADVLLVSAAVWALDLLLGHTLLKRAQGRLVACLPFFLGIALYAAYAAATGGLAAEAEAGGVISSGITCGSLATVANVVCGKLTKSDKGGATRAEAVKQLLAVFGEISDEDAAAIAEAVGKDADKAKELLGKIAGDGAEMLYPVLEKVLGAL